MSNANKFLMLKQLIKVDNPQHLTKLFKLILISIIILFILLNFSNIAFLGLYLI